MKENFFTSMFSEGGKISHKRWISVTAAAAAIFAFIYSVIKYKEFTVTMFQWVLVFILIMSGVATVAQVLSIVKGTPAPKEDENKTTTDEGK